MLRCEGETTDQETEELWDTMGYKGIRRVAAPGLL